MSSTCAADLASPLTALAGVGPVRAARLARLGLHCLRDLLLLVPRGLERQGERVRAADAPRCVGREVSVTGQVKSPRIFRARRRGVTVSVELHDDTGHITARFFNQGWMHKRLKELAASGEAVELYGQVVEGKGGVAIIAPRMATTDRPLPAPGTASPVYSLTEGIGLNFLRGLTRNVADEYAEHIAEALDAETLAAFDLPALGVALACLHSPPSEIAFLQARRRLALERLLRMQAALQDTSASEALGAARTVTLSATELEERIRSLPHSPTPSQRRALREIAHDLGRTKPMRRLLQGDVGSGKTLVALGAISIAAAGGGQSAFLAPTEILAEQHFMALSPWLASLGIRAVLLTGSLPTATKRKALAQLKDGSVQLVVGTHAIMSREMAFARLDLAVIDEQQRFGVEAKLALLNKGSAVHTLLLTATPIPRTLALSIYGDLEVSVMTHKPKGRGALKTHFVEPGKRARMLRFMGERMDEGERVFWVCPRIASVEAEDASTIAAAEEAHTGLTAGPLGRHPAALVHGRLPADVRARRIGDFRAGRARLLVATSIIEVGVDVPEATVMVIEGCERFGLAQLHQLRGRVGRGPKASWCFLLGAPESHERLRLLEQTSDGFRIAEEDMRQRGMGDLVGLRQAGKNVEGLDDPATDTELVQHARRLITDDARLREHYASFALAATPALV